jgi:penicillin-binding protein 1A
VQAAARVFFDKPAKELKLHEAATLAGLPQAPSQYNPFTAEENALRRRNQVLAKMAELGMVQPETAAAAQERPLGVELSRYYTARRRASSSTTCARSSSTSTAPTACAAAG